MAREAPVLWEVVEEHLDEAAFLWLAWERALVSPATTIGAIASGPERRLLAHLEALAVGGEPVARRLLAPALAGGEPGPAFAAAWVLAQAGREAEVLGALGAAAPPPRAAIRRALELSSRPGIDAGLLRLAAEGAPPVRAEALEALASRGVDAGEAVRVAGSAPEPALRAAALRAARCAKGRWVPDLLRAGLEAADAAVRDAAIESGLVVGLREAWAACARAAAGGAPSPRAMLLLGLGGDEAEQEPLLAAAAAAAAPRRAALLALGHAGRVAAADACLGAMAPDDPAAARLAGEAFAAITGLAIVPPYQAPEPPEPEEPVPFEAEELDADLVPGPEASLALPDRDAIEPWWQKARGDLAPGARHLLGKPRDAAAVVAALQHGPARRRHALALELEIRSRGALRLSTRTWATAQRLPPEGLGRIDLSRPFRAIVTGG